jgi:hypothetical protein
MQEVKHIRFPRNVNVRQYNEWVKRALPFQDSELRFLFYVPSSLLGSRYINRAIKTTSLDNAPSFLSDVNLVEIEQMEQAVAAHKSLIGPTGVITWTETTDELSDLSETSAVEVEPAPPAKPSRRRKPAAPVVVETSDEDEVDEVEPTNDGDTPDPVTDLED